MASEGRAGRWATRGFWVFVAVGPILGILLEVCAPASFGAVHEWAVRFAETFGAWTVPAFLALQVVQVVVPPLSHYTVGYMGGFLFGPWLGTLYNFLGRVAGHACAFWLARTVGKRLAERWVPRETRERYDRLVGSRPFVLFLIYFLPFLPDDEVTWLVGLSGMPFRWFLLANLLGQVGGSLTLAYLGAGVAGRDAAFWIVIGLALAGCPLLWWLARRAAREADAGESGGAA